MQRVGGDHPEHVRQIERQFDIVVAERIVLLGVQHLQQRRAGIAPEVRTHLVDFVQQKYRILGPHRLHALDDPARQRAHIGAPVAANLSLVPDAAQRNPHEFSLHGAGDRPGQRSLADAGRADQAQDRSLHGFRQLPHRQIFQNAFLDFFQTVMVFVQIFFRQINVQAVLGLDRPGQAQQPVQIRPDHAAFRRHRRHLLQPVDFLGDPFRYFLGQILVLHLLAVFFRLGSPLVLFTQFLLDRLHLLPQEIFLLRLLHLLADPSADFLLDLKNLHLAVDNVRQQAEAFLDVDRRQQFLLVFQFQRQMPQNQVAEAIRIFDGDHRHQRFRRNLLAQFRPLLELAGQQTGLCLQFRRLAGGNLPEFLHFDFEIRIFLQITVDPGPVEAFHQHPHSPAGQLQQLLDLGDRPGLVDIGGARLVVLGVALRRQHDQAVLHHDLFQGIDRFFAAHVEMDNHIRKDQYPPQRQHDHRFELRFVFRHGKASLLPANPKSCPYISVCMFSLERQNSCQKKIPGK